MESASEKSSSSAPVAFDSARGWTGRVPRGGLPALGVVRASPRRGAVCCAKTMEKASTSASGASAKRDILFFTVLDNLSKNSSARVSLDRRRLFDPRVDARRGRFLYSNG